MTNYFVDSTTGDNGDDGTTMDLAWATLEYAMESGGLSSGDIVWVRRIHGEVPLSVISPVYDGTPFDPLSFIGWPRAADDSISEATWANGSTTVDLIVGLVMDDEKHLGRYITGPDGFDYIITLVTDGNTIEIDREYASTNASGADGACTIKADEDWVDDMGTEYGFDDSGWTIKEAAWDADADDLPIIDFDSTAVQLAINADVYYYMANIWFKDADHATGVINITTSPMTKLSGCVISQSSNRRVINALNCMYSLHRCILIGSGTGGHTGNYGIISISSNGRIVDSAMYNTSAQCLYCQASYHELENLNLGVEQANLDSDLWIFYDSRIRAKDLKFGANINEFEYSAPTPLSSIDMENYNKTLGSHVRICPAGTVTKLDVVAGSGDPYKRTGGADSVVEVLFNFVGGNAYAGASPSLDPVEALFIHEFEATTDSKNYRYYVNAEEAVAASELWIEVEYVSAYDDTSEYVNKRVISTEAISQQADNEDWTQYMEVTGITPAVGSKVRIKCYCSFYHATAKIYIDPKVVITDG